MGAENGNKLCTPSFGRMPTCHNTSWQQAPSTAAALEWAHTVHSRINTDAPKYRYNVCLTQSHPCTPTSHVCAPQSAGLPEQLHRTDVYVLLPSKCCAVWMHRPSGLAQWLFVLVPGHLS